MTHPLPVLETACTDEALRAVRVLVDAYRLTADSRDADRILNGILDCVARLVDYDSAAVYVLGSSGRHVRHFWWRDASGRACHDGPHEGRPSPGPSTPASRCCWTRASIRPRGGRVIGPASSCRWWGCTG